MNKIAESGVNKGLNLVKETVQVLFIDYTGIRREESFSLDETLSTLPNPTSFEFNNTTPVLPLTEFTTLESLLLIEFHKR